MQKLIEALNQIEANVPHSDDISFATALDRVHVTYLRRALGLDQSLTALESSDEAALRRLALYLEAEMVLGSPSDHQHIQDALYVAATIFEYLGQLETLTKDGDPTMEVLSKRLWSGDLANYMRALLLYSLGRHESNSAVIGRRIINVIEHEPEPVTIHDRAVLLGLRIIVALVSRELTQAALLGRALGDAIDSLRKTWELSPVDPDQTRFLAVWLELSEALVIVAMGMLESAEDLVDRGLNRLKEAETKAIALRQAFPVWVASNLILLVEQMQERSVARVLQGIVLPPNYLSALVSSGTIEFWSSQLEVLNQGLLEDERSFVVNMPTGSGKSLLAELVIVQTLSIHRGAWGVYLVPSRALVHQVESDLRRRLPALGISVRTVVAGLEPVGILDEELEELTTPRTLTILTPEKLDIYFRSRPEAFSECRIVILDEAHKIGDRGRGAVIDSLVTRFRLLAPEVRFLFLSAVISNVLEVAEWLGNPSGGVRSGWRPTRQLKGLAVRQVTGTEPWHSAKGKSARRKRTVAYNVGAILANRASDIDQLDHVEFSLPNLIETKGVEVRESGGTIKWEGPTSTEHAAELAVKFERLPGVVLVFLIQKKSVEVCARRIAQSHRRREFSTHPATPAVVEQLTTLLGSKHELVNLVRRGVAYYHSDLPMPVRRTIESALKDGALHTLCSTAGLQEGLNTPATTVIVSGTVRYGGATNSAEPEQMSVADFANIAGRAGRAGKDTEGQVILLPTNLGYVSSVRKQGREYLFPSEDMFYVRSGLQAIENALEQARFDELETQLSPEAQVTLLALYAAGLASEDDLVGFFAGTLANQQTRKPAEVLARVAHSYLDRKISETSKEQVEIYSKTALPFDDCVKLESELQSLLDSGFDVSIGLSSLGSVDANRLGPLLAAVLAIDRLRPRVNQGHDPYEIAEALALWMNGAAYRDLAALPMFGGKVEGVVKFVGAAGNELSWGLGSAFLMLDRLTSGVLDPEFGLVPLFVEFGVNRATAAYLSLLGVTDREAAHSLAQAYDDDQTDQWAKFGAVEEWVTQLSAQDVISIVGRNDLSTQILLGDLGLLATTSSRPDRVRLSLLVRLQDELLVSAPELIGELCGFRISAFDERQMEVFGQVSGQNWGFATLAGSQPSFTSETIGRMIGIGFEPGRQPGTLFVRAWLAANQGDGD